MTEQTFDRADQEQWLQRYYFVRAAVSLAWVAAVVALAAHSAIAGAILLVAYPVWDALCNLADGQRSGGLRANRTQFANVLVSIAVAVALAAALPDMHRVLAVFGTWAILSGLLQLGTALRRWKRLGAQWAMVLSGAQSALAGGFFLYQARLPEVPTITSLAGYAGVGALYFLVSASLLAWRAARSKRA